MQVTPTDAALQAAPPTAAGVTARVVAGNLAALPLGALLQATVTSVTPREAVLTVNGQALTVRLPPGAQLQPGAVLLVRVPLAANATNPTLELGVPPGAAPRGPTGVTDAIGRAATSTTTPTTRPANDGAKPAAVGAQPRLAVVDVLNPLPDGRVRVRIDGEEQIATTAEPLAPGGRYVLQVARTSAGLALKSPPDGPTLPTEVATAVLRTPAPTLAAALKPLQAELAALAAPPASGSGRAVPVAVREAATAVGETLRALLPSETRPPDATQLQQLVENGGLHYEAKLARLVVQADAPVANAERPAHEVGPDLKGDLLRLLQTVQDLGGAARAPAAQAALHGIESQQAANALAQANGTPYYLQVPFPDGGVWRTLRLSLEPQNRPDRPDADRAGRFRLFMHVPLTDLGETWIEAGLADDTFRATIYLDSPAVRDRVRAALPDLRTELQADGFSEVLLDVRASSDLPERHRREAGALQAGRPETVSVLDVRV